MKKDIASRLAHKKPYERIELEPKKQIDILIVVNQMLTGFDSKWINTLYIDKMIEYENIIQAFSRTNRLFGPDKPFGVIRYYRRPHTMEENIKKAIQLYSGDKPYGLFAEKLNSNLKNMNSIFDQISNLFESAGIQNFEKLPKQKEDKCKFAQLFNLFNKYLEAAKIQRMTWDKEKYEFDLENREKEVITREIDEKTYLILVQRYKELQGGGSGGSDSIPFDVETYITEIDTGLIDSDYMNSKFNKYLKALAQPDVSKEEVAKIKDELHKTFATLSVEEQKYANLILHDIDSGDFKLNVNEKSFRDCITEYISNAKNDQIHKLSMALGLNETLLREAVALKLNESNLNEFGRFDKVVETVDKTKAKLFFEKKEGIKLVRYNPYIKTLLVEFNSKKISVENVIFKIATILSEIYGFSKIKFISNNNKTDMPLLSYYSIILILGAKIVKYVSPTGQVQEFLKWLATGTTVGAIVEHGYSEMRQRGTIDPEVMSIMYLINSIGKEGNMLNASLVTWITTFGRHILKKSNETFILKIEKSKMRCEDKPCYDISILSEDINNNNKLDSFRLFANEIIERQNSLNSGFGYRGGGSINNEGMFFNLK